MAGFLPLVSVLVFLAVQTMVFSAKTSLKCYKCHDCEGATGTISTCEMGYDTCVKFMLGDRIEKTCARKDVCNAASSFEKRVLNTWTQFKSYFSQIDGDAIERGGDQATSINCCPDELCNSGVLKTVSPLLAFIVPFVLRF